HRHDDGDELRPVQGAKAGHQRRQYGQNHTQVRNNAQEAADEAQKIKEGQVQRPEDSNPHQQRKQTKNNVTVNKSPHNLGNTPQGYIGGVAVFHVEQHHRGRAYVVLPGEHKENQKWNKRHHQQQLAYGAEILANQV